MNCQKAPRNGFRFVTNHTRIWLTILNVLAVISFISIAFSNQILRLVNHRQPFILLSDIFFIVNVAVLTSNIVYFILTSASEVFIIEPTFFTGKTSRDGSTKEYRFKIVPYSIDKWRFKAWIQKVEIRPLTQLQVSSAEQEDGSKIRYNTFQRKGGELTCIQLNREIRKGFFLSFSLKPEKDLDDIEDIDSFERSLSIEVSIFYRKSFVPFEQIKEIPW